MPSLSHQTESFRKGLGKHLFASLRYRDDGSENPDFVLNRAAYRKATILVADDNFGCGSSREHAPWALLDFGFRCIIAPSFADIFYNNCLKNGILPITLPRAIVEQCLKDAQNGENARFRVDLAGQTIERPDDNVIHFDIDPTLKQHLIEGTDDVTLTMKDISAIQSFEDDNRRSRPWLWSGASS